MALLAASARSMRVETAGRRSLTSVAFNLMMRTVSSVSSTSIDLYTFVGFNCKRERERERGNKTKSATNQPYFDVRVLKL